MNFFKRFARKINNARIVVFRPENELLDGTGYVPRGQPSTIFRTGTRKSQPW